jgi:hypothetical protein
MLVHQAQRERDNGSIRCQGEQTPISIAVFAAEIALDLRTRRRRLIPWLIPWRTKFHGALNMTTKRRSKVAVLFWTEAIYRQC